MSKIDNLIARIKTEHIGRTGKNVLVLACGYDTLRCGR